MLTTADTNPGKATRPAIARATRPTASRPGACHAATTWGIRLASTIAAPTTTRTRRIDPSGTSSSSGAWAVMAGRVGARSGTARLTRPARGGNQHAVEHHQRGKGGHRQPAWADQVEVGVAAAQGLKAGSGDHQQEGAVGQATSPAGG
jgi:hypothetical protein